MINIIKMAAGLKEVSEMERRAKALMRGEHVVISTKNCPTRADELLDGGSVYWVFASQILCRQAIVKIDKAERCLISLSPEIIRVTPTPRKAFQGWRYLDPKESPADLRKGRESEPDMPTDVSAELARLGLI